MNRPNIQSDELLAFMYQIPVAMARIDLNGDIKMLTPRAVALLECVTRSGTLDNLFHVLDPVAPVIHHLVAAFAGESGVVCEELPVTIHGGTGKVNALELEVTIRKINGQELMIVLADVTSQRQAEEERSALASIVESSDDAIIAKSLDGIITSWNAGAERMYGYRRTEVIGKPISLIVPTQRQYEEAMFLEQVRDGRSIKHHDTVRLRKDGTALDVSVSMSPVCNTRGVIVGVSAISHDISDRVAAAAALQESEVRFRSLANSAPVLIWLAGLDKLCYWFNDVWLSFTGRTLEQEQGNGWAEGVHPEDLDGCIDTYVTCFDNRHCFTMEYRLLRNDGSYRWILDSGTPTFANGAFTGYVGSCIDITEQKELSASLEASERFMRKLIDVLPGMVGYWDNDLRCGFANRAYQEWFGKTPEQMKDIHIHDLMGDGLFKRNEQFITAALAGEQQHFERTLSKPDGTSGYTWANYIPDSDADGVHGFFVLVTDVTDLKKAEASLTAQDQFYKSTLDGIRSHICVINEQGTIVTTNRAWESFGAENDAIPEHSSIGSNYFFACQPLSGEQDPTVAEFVTGISSVLNGTLPEFIKEYPCHTPTKELWFVCKASRFTINGTIYGVITHEDITWRKVAEQQLRMLSRAVDQSPVSIIITDTQGAIEFVNPHFTTLSGYTAEEVLGKNPRILKSKLTDSYIFEELWATIKAGQSWEGEFINNSKNGDINFEQAKISPLRDDDGIITHFIGIKENINKRKEMEASLVDAKEKAEIASRAKDEFLAVMSHEMRTPLNGLLGMSDLLLDSELTEEQREFADIVHQCGKNLLAIISDILDFTLVRVKKLDVELKDINLRTCLDETMGSFTSRAAGAGLGLTSRIAPEVPSLVRGDGGKVQQILTSLIDNALKFTQRGAVVISVSVCSVKNSSVVLRFDVHDTGIGMAESRLADVFTAFTQVDSSSTRSYGGTGLGLALAKELATLLGGEIGVTSEQGKGSTFWFTATMEICGKGELQATVPAALPQPVLEGAPPAVPENSVVEGVAVRILMAEDNPINQKTALHLLKNLGYKADVATDGLKTVRALEIAEYDLVLMDCMMPEMSGYEATEVIRDVTSHVLNHGVPIIAVTANVMDGDREKCLQCGMDDYLAKPLTKKALSEMLDKWLSPEKSQ